MDKHESEASLSSTGAPGVEASSDLRVKYLDYCSAILTDVFLSLSDERIYDLVQEAAEESGRATGSLGFQSMVHLLTRKLRRSVPLPDFESWAEDYAEHPERYDPLILGLWSEESSRPDPEEAGR